MLGSLSGLPAALAYPVLFLIVGGESAGLPLPGETSLVAAGILASHGRLSLSIVIASAAAGAIVGDNVGYLLGRHGGRALLTRGGRWASMRTRLLKRGDVFFERHGAKTVFFGRWLPGLRIVAAWLAGANRMPWGRFVIWNTLGGAGWAVSIGLAAYLLGGIASQALHYAGLGGVGLVVGAVLSLLAWHRLRLRARENRAVGRSPTDRLMRLTSSRLLSRRRSIFPGGQ